MDYEQNFLDDTQSAVASDGSNGGDTSAVQVVTVDELLERIASADQEQQSGDCSAEESEQQSLTASYTDLITEIRDNVSAHPAMTTDFTEYTVSEFLLLAMLLSLFVSALVKMIKGGFRWLY